MALALALLAGPGAARAGTATVAGVPSATGRCGVLTVTAPYSGDDDQNNSLYFSTSPAGAAQWTGLTQATAGHRASPYVFTIPDLALGALYDVRLYFFDSGGSPGYLYVTGVSGGSTDCTAAGAVTVTQGLGATPSLVVSASYSSDSGANNGLSYRIRTPSGTGAWSGATTLGHAPSPYVFTASGLACGASHDVEVTWLDADGVAGAASQLVTATPTRCSAAGVASAALPSCIRADVAAPVSFDANGDGATTFERGAAATGPWAPACTATGAGPRSCADAALLPSTSYWYRVTTSDPDGVSGPATQVIGPYVTTACDLVVPQALTVTVGSCALVTAKASFLGDSNATGAVAFERAGAAAGPFTPVRGCGSVAGPSPRTCDDVLVTPGSVYWYRASFTDPDGVVGASPVAGPMVVPPCAGGGVLTLRPHPLGQAGAVTGAPGSSSAAVARFALEATVGQVEVTSLQVAADGTAAPRQDVTALLLYRDADGSGTLSAGDALVGTALWDRLRARYALPGFSVPVGTTSYVLVAGVGSAARPGATFTPSLAPAEVAVLAPSVVTPGAAAPGGTLRVTGTPLGQPAGSTAASTHAPSVSILNPGRGAATGRTFRVQVQVHSPLALTATCGAGAQPCVELGTDGATFPYLLAQNPRYGAAAGANAGVYEKTLTLAPGSYLLQARATSAAGTIYSAPIDLVVSARGGDGNLLGRESSSQLCADCHAVKSHGSQSTADRVSGLSRYGSWSTNCRDCHDVHGTSNTHLLRGEIAPPPVNGYQGHQPVRFGGRGGFGQGGSAATGSYANQDGSGPCQVCHTRTSRWTASGPVDAWHRGDCAFCHPHQDGFRARPCDDCHGAPPATGAHLAHYRDSRSPPLSFYADTRILQDYLPGGGAGYVFGCGNCHPLDFAKHGNGQVEVELHDPAAPAGSLKARASPSAAYERSGGTCSGVYCHSSGQRAPAYAATPGWRSGAHLGCNGCHANPPRYASGGAGADTANSHLYPTSGYPGGHFGGLPSWSHGSLHGRQATHMGASPITCQTCHYATTDPAGAGPSGFYWLDTTGDYTWPGDSGDPACPSCHTGAAGKPPPGAGRVLPLRHVNGTRDVVLDPRTSLTVATGFTWLPAGADQPSRPYWESPRQLSTTPPVATTNGVTLSLDVAAGRYDPAAKTCTVACHLSGETVPWGRNAGCGHCHY
ncbi:CxxxxCH/CxxCH domain c-type cytochrome [Anaeromyxobacter paludicola]|uniref:CxxxxCH/CxxCH domain c-type cytochrome n=1 Tax=Anaeromyxobacter paludicola TaxID=2918171 RepID=UPI0020C07E4B|nr:CxxxxCH/CxxCH domain-containing protein [Anaeromyxobacter paludicola]